MRRCSATTALALSAALLSVTSAPASSLVSAPSPRQSWVAKVIFPTMARSAPSRDARTRGVVSAVSAWGTPVALLVLGAQQDATGVQWLRVRLDHRPNGFAAWVDARDTVLGIDPWWIVVSRRRERVWVYRSGRLLRAFAAVVGKPSTPTPAGLFAVAAELRQPDPGEFLGSWVLPLTAHSDALRHYAGGDGQVALHGRGGASLADPLGSARSHGCVRLENSAIGWIARHVPVGTPLLVR